MSKQVPQYEFPRPSGPWSERIAFAKASPVAFVPNEIVVIGNEAAAKAAASIQGDGPTEIKPIPIAGDGFLLRVPFEITVEDQVAELAKLGLRVEPNYIFFAHGQSLSSCDSCRPSPCCCGLGGHPFAATPFAATPFAATPFAATAFAANPFAATSVTANPFAANPFAATPFAATSVAANPFAATSFATSGVRQTSARPADAPPADSTIVNLPKQNAVHAIIYDTGVSVKKHLPAELASRPKHNGAKSIDRDEPDESGDDILDPVAGHGSFIAGIIEQLVPKQVVEVHAVLSTFGDGTAATIAERITKDVDAMSDEVAQSTVMNMSFGSYADQQMYLLAEAVAYAQSKGCVVVASAGNDGTHVPSFPATLPGVIGVASIDDCGRAPYSNFGPWVRACAPGTDVVSSFFNAIDKNQAPIPGEAADPDGFNGWACWSGTSFAAPVVASAILRQMALHDQPAQEAAKVVIDSPGLLKLPGLGTVVNLTMGM